MTGTEGGTAATVPLAFDIAWLFVGVAWLLIPLAIAVAERRRGASSPDTCVWFLLAFLLPVVGLIIWALYRTVESRRSATR